jgi:2-phospho-L-lactate guanylyltransferase
MNDADLEWTVVLPLKGGSAAKSRLGGPAPLATAIALDCLHAVLAGQLVGSVVVVTPDPLLAAEAAAAGARVRPESNPGAGLLAALDDGLAGTRGRCAVLLGDLPALRPGDLSSALRQAALALTTPITPTGPTGPTGPPRMVFVPDADGTGTVLLAALDAAALAPSFGPGSARAHQAAGAIRLDVDLPRLRRDVDTSADLRTAVALGVGPRTQAVLAQLAKKDAEPAVNRA